MSTSFLVCRRCGRLVYPTNHGSVNMCMCLQPLTYAVSIEMTSSTCTYMHVQPPRTTVPAAFHDAFKDGDLDL